MPRIILKPFSAQFADDHEPGSVAQRCDMPGCPAEGLHRAPKDRSLSDHYRFCTEHVQEYNKAWDFFSGMSPDDIENHIVNSIYGERPTRRYDGMAQLEELLSQQAWQTRAHSERNERRKETPSVDRNTPEFQALALMGLEPPLNAQILKTRYRELVKKHHPDTNGGNPESEELLKSINMAYTILKLACEKYERLPKDG